MKKLSELLENLVGIGLLTRQSAAKPEREGSTTIESITEKKSLSE